MTTSDVPYEPCGSCGAPLGDNQRYCVVCGTNRRHPEDPVARYLADAKRRKATATAPAVAVRGESRWTAVALALLPLAAGIGVLVGGGGGSSEADEKLLAALRDRPAAGIGAAGAAAASTALPSDFALDKGWTIRIGTLPFRTTTRDTADEAIAGAEDKGAKKVGLINPDEFVLTPDTNGDYLLYTGEYKSKQDAEKALKGVKKDFPDAKVVKVGASTGGSAAGVDASGSKLDSAEDEEIAAQQHPTEQQKQDGAQIVQEIQATKGKPYVQQQRKLPDTIVIP